MPQKYKVIWADVANEDLIDIIQNIRLDSPLAAADNLKKIKDKTSGLAIFPQKGRVVPELHQQGILQYHELIVPPWRVIYRISAQTVYILSVIDSRRNIEDILLNRLTR